MQRRRREVNAMRRILVVVAAGMLAWLVTPARAADTVSGEVVDLACYMPHPQMGQGNAHRKCADTCVKKGLPMGLLTQDKQVFLLLEDHENPKPYAQLKEKAAEKVTVEGEKVTQGGVQGLVVESLK
jgi:hypothetical protein